MNISILSNAPWARTGYGNQVALFAPRFMAMGHKVAITAFYGLEGGVLGFNTPHGDIPVYPRGGHPYGLDVMAAHAAHFKADVIISLIDAWVIEPSVVSPGLMWCPWYPVDHEPLPVAIRDRIARAYARIVYSRFGERMTQDAGLDCYYVPHGIDTGLFRPVDRDEAKERLGFPKDKFIVGMVAANKGTPSRKAFMQNIAAFAALKHRHPDSMLYLHTVKDDLHGGVNLPEYIQSLGLTWTQSLRPDAKQADVVFCDQYQNNLGYPEEYMNAAYNSMDVLLSVSMGEGFGIPIVEAQATGCPVIVGDWTSMPELCFSGWMVAKADAEPFWTPLAAYQFIPHVPAITDLLLAAYDKAGNEDYRRNAREGALAYDADRVAGTYWQPTLADLAERVAMWKDAFGAQQAVMT